MKDLEAVYQAPRTAAERAVRDALERHQSEIVGDAVVAALTALANLYEIKATEAEIEAAERLVAARWAAYLNPTGVFYKG